MHPAHQQTDAERQGRRSRLEKSLDSPGNDTGTNEQLTRWIQQQDYTDTFRNPNLQSQQFR